MNGMTLQVKVAVRFVCATIMLFGLYLMVHGESSPGGGIAGGVILSSAFVLLTLAFGGETASRKLSVNGALLLQSLGALIVLAVAVVRMFWGDFAGSIDLCDIGVGMALAGALYALFMALSGFRIDGKKEK